MVGVKLGTTGKTFVGSIVIAVTVVVVPVPSPTATEASHEPAAPAANSYVQVRGLVPPGAPPTVIAPPQVSPAPTVQVRVSGSRSASVAIADPE